MLSSSEGVSTNLSETTIRIDFQEPVTNFDDRDLTLDLADGASGYIGKMNRSSKLDVYWVPLFMARDGSYTVGFGTSATYTLSNTEILAGSITVYKATSSIQVRLSSSQGSSTNQSSVQITIEFDKAVRGLTMDSLILAFTGSVRGRLQDIKSESSGSLFTVWLQNMTGQGLYTVSLAPNSCKGKYGAPTSGGSITIQRDTIPPGPPEISLANGLNAVNNAAEVRVLIRFDEEIEALLESSLSLLQISGKARRGAIGRVGPQEFTVDIIWITDNGEVLLSFPFGAVQDLAGNPAPAGQITIIRDTQAPVPSLVSNVGHLTNANSLAIGVDFGEAVVGFSVDNWYLAPYKGIYVRLHVVDETRGLYELQVPRLLWDGKYQFTLESTLEKPISDVAGNIVVSAAINVTRDTENPPSARMWSDMGNVTNSDKFTLYIDFGQDVQDFTVNNLDIFQGERGELTQNNSQPGFFYVEITNIQTLVICRLLPGPKNLAGNLFGAGLPTVFTLFFNTTVPHPPVLTCMQGTVTNQMNLTIEINFGESVLGFDASDIEFSQDWVTLQQLDPIAENDLVQSEAARYMLSVTAVGVGAFDVSVKAFAATNIAGTGFPGNKITILRDTSPPMPPVFESSTGWITNKLNLSIMVKFQEPVLDVVSLNQSLQFVRVGTSFGVVKLETALQSLEPPSSALTSYILDVSNMMEEGTYVLGISDQAVRDVAGNYAPSASVVITRVDTHPELEIVAPDNTRMSEISVSIVFNRPVYFKESNNIRLVKGKGSLEPLSAINGSHYSVVLSMREDGVYVLSVPEGSAMDIAGNPSKAQTKIIRRTTGVLLPLLTTVLPAEVEDSTLQPSRLVVSGSNVTVYVQFPRQLRVFDDAAVELRANGQHKALRERVQPSKLRDNLYYISMYNISVEAEFVLTLLPGAAIDLADNPSPQVSVLIARDTAFVGTSKLTADSLLTNNETVYVRVIFGEETVLDYRRVQYESSGGLEVWGGLSVEAVDLKLGQYLVTITGLVDQGTLKVFFGPDAATDLAGNPAPGGEIFIVRDTESPNPPTLDLFLDGLSSTDGIPVTNARRLQIILDFGETVLNFDTAALSLESDVVMGRFENIAELDGPRGQYRVDISALEGQGQFVVSLLPETVTDVAGNYVPTASLRLERDSTSPAAPLLVSNVGRATNSNNWTVFVEFAENVVGLSQDAFALTHTGYTLSAKLGPLRPFQYTNTLAGARVFAIDVLDVQDEGTYQISFPSGSCTDFAGNPAPGGSLAVVWDITPPAAPIIRASVGPLTSAGYFTFTVIYSEEVVGFTDPKAGLYLVQEGDVPASIGKVIEVSPSEYLVEVVDRVDEQELIFVIPQGFIKDIAGNVAEGANFTVQQEARQVRLLSANGLVTASDSVQIFISFGEPVIDFRPDRDVRMKFEENPAADTVTGNVGFPLVVDENRGLFSVTVFNISGEGSFTVLADTTYVTDLKGEPWPPSFITIYRKEARGTLDIRCKCFLDPNSLCGCPDRTKASTLTFFLDFKEEVFGLTTDNFRLGYVGDDQEGDQEPLYVGRISLLLLIQKSTGLYVLQVRVAAYFEGGLYIEFVPGEVVGVSGDYFEPARLDFVRDATPPLSVITLPGLPYLHTNAVAILGYVTFSGDPVSQLTQRDIRFTTQRGDVTPSLIGLQRVDNNTFSFQVEMDGEGMFTIFIRPGAVLDLAGNPSTGSSISLTRKIQIPAPPSMLSDRGLLINATSVNVQIDFGEPVLGFEKSDLLLSFSSDGVSNAGEMGELVVLNATLGLFSISIEQMTVDGLYSLLFSAGSATDLAGNRYPGTQITIERDTIPPQRPQVSASVPLNTDAETFDLYIRYSEPVLLNNSMIALKEIGNSSGRLASITSLAGNPWTFSAKVVNASGKGSLVLIVPDGAVTDYAGNPTLGASLTIYRRCVSLGGQCLTESCEIGQSQCGYKCLENSSACNSCSGVNERMCPDNTCRQSCQNVEYFGCGSERPVLCQQGWCVADVQICSMYAAKDRCSATGSFACDGSSVCRASCPRPQFLKVARGVSVSVSDLEFSGPNNVRTLNILDDTGEFAAQILMASGSLDDSIISIAPVPTSSFPSSVFVSTEGENQGQELIPWENMVDGIRSPVLSISTSTPVKKPQNWSLATGGTGAYSSAGDDMLAGSQVVIDNSNVSIIFDIALPAADFTQLDWWCLAQIIENAWTCIDTVNHRNPALLAKLPRITDCFLTKHAFSFYHTFMHSLGFGVFGMV